MLQSEDEPGAAVAAVEGAFEVSGRGLGSSPGVLFCVEDSLYAVPDFGGYEGFVHADDNHDQAHPSENPDSTARSVLYGVLQHVGAELSAHETVTAEHERWGSMTQLASEYETIAQAAQHDRWAALIHASGLTPEQAESVLSSKAFGALIAELRRAETNHHDVAALLPRLLRPRGFEDADDNAVVLHYRVERDTERPAGSDSTRKPPRLIVGLISSADGAMGDGHPSSPR
jgi:hypothetical protein